MKKWLQTIALVILILVFPILPKFTVAVASPRYWLTVILALALNLTQPSYSLKDIPTRSKTDAYSMLILLFSGSMVFLLPVLDFIYTLGPRIAASHFMLSLGIGLALFGILFRYHSIRVLGQFFETKVNIQENHLLIKSGPYSTLRHPSYTGTFVLAIGIALYMNSLLAMLFIVVGLLPAYLYRIHCEEAALIEAFGQEYKDYVGETKRLIPFVY